MTNNMSLAEYRRIMGLDSPPKASQLFYNAKMSSNECKDQLIVLCEPIGKPRMTQSDKWKHRKCVDRYYKYADLIRLEAEDQNFVLSDSFEIIFNMPIPKSLGRKKKIELEDMPHKVKPDIDNLLKGVMDALKKTDQTVYLVKASKFYSCITGFIINNL